MIKFCLIAMTAWLLAGVGAALQEDYERNAASIWCVPGEMLVYVWKDGADGRPERAASRKCVRERKADVIYYEDEDGIVVRRK